MPSRTAGRPRAGTPYRHRHAERRSRAPAAQRVPPTCADLDAHATVADEPASACEGEADFGDDKNELVNAHDILVRHSDLLRRRGTEAAEMWSTAMGHLNANDNTDARFIAPGDPDHILRPAPSEPGHRPGDDTPGAGHDDV
ncbi:hypothetical protein OG715_00685 [Kitasatospora purpeofusca]|uniref:hypothetical protein n=1 Tax=Kitasatospora purpeofusca TaxID=67352 RepID=UPI002E0E8571|nr:hypothetical protein OG715_00685 [Kitasatospora purpeofusca]